MPRTDRSDAPRLHYLTARWELMDLSAALRLFDRRDRDASFDRVPLGAVSRLPLALQVAFRRKLLVIFALQLLCVAAVSAACRFWAPARRLADLVVLDASAALALSLGAASTLALLSALVAVRRRFPLNWLVLLLFTATQSAAAVALGELLDSDVVAVNCTFALVGVSVMCALCGVRRHRRPALASEEREGLVLEEYDDDDKQVLLSTLSTSLLAYAAASTLFLCLGGWHALTSNHGSHVAAYSLLFQLLLALWFSIDVASMYRAMSPDEYMLGVVNFYIDFVLLVVLTAIAVAVVALVTATCAACADSNSGGGGGGGCECPCRDGADVDAAVDCCDCCVQACDVCCVIGASRRDDDATLRRRRATAPVDERDREDDETQRLHQPLLGETVMERV